MSGAWVQLKDISRAKTLLILPCNAAACIGNYFKAEFYSKKKWNTWLEADAQLHDLREKGRVAFAAVDSVTLENQPDDPRGAIVFETEMGRVRNDEGEDWGAPSWKWFRPTPLGEWNYLEELIDALVMGVARVEGLGFSQVFTMVNPKGYFLALAAAVDKCGLSNKWVQFRVPAHPRYLLKGVQHIAFIIRAAIMSKDIKGGIYPIPEFYSAMLNESKIYRDRLPEFWGKFDSLPSAKDVKRRWEKLRMHSKGGLI